MPWYYAEAGRQAGPVDDDTFNSLVASGRITSDTLVWSPGMPNWQPYQMLNAAVATIPGAPPVPAGLRYCSECGRPFSNDDMVAFGSALVCAECKPLFAQKLREGVVPATAFRYGGFWIRVLALMIDGLILQVVAMFYTPFLMSGHFDPRDTSRVFVVFGMLTGIGFVVSLVYETWFVGRFGATPGKMVCRLKVVRPDGRPLTYQRSLGRVLCRMLDTATLWIGYIIAAFDDEKRALHDRICDTRVVRT